ncbi:MAG: penicillin-binding protein [Bacilli bacterium]|nr:penicillin-binding protein [Bacilli bacterium]
MKAKKTKAVVKVNFFAVLIVIVMFILIIAKLSYVVLSEKVDGIDLTKFADSRNTVEKTLYASRGSIYDKNGEILAQSVNSYTVVAYLSSSRTKDEEKPQHVVDKENTAKLLAPLLNMSEERIITLLSKDAYQVELGPGGRNISELKKKKIEELNLPGIDFTINTKRYYKMGTFASYVIGYAKENEDGGIEGEMGIEEYYNEKLKGTNGKKTYQKDAYGYQMPNAPYYIEPASPGNDIYLTIDSNIQLFAENAISKVEKNGNFTWMTFSIMDAKTGAIVASATSPNFNLNKLETLKSYLNPLVSYQYEPGSTMKIFSFMAAMENGVYNGSEKYESGKIDVADVTIKDFNNVGFGVIDFDTGFAYSSNVAATKLGLKLGVKRLKSFYNDLGFGSKTGVDLPGELAGQINFTYQSELATASFGQGITTTPIQNLQALSVLANDGELLQPYIVDKMVDSEGNVVYQSQRKSLGKKVSSETVSKMTGLLHKAVYDSITTNKYYQAKTVTLIGKTGTAQIPSDKGGYLTGETNYIKSFAGLFPEEDPKYVIYVSVKQYDGHIMGLTTPIVEAVDDIANYANISTTVTQKDNNKIAKVDNYLNQPINVVTTLIEQKGLVPIVMGNGSFVINNYPNKDSQVVLGSKVFLLTNGSLINMLDLNGWSKSDVLTYCNMLSIKCNLNGNGYAFSQSIAGGSEINKDTVVDINFTK